MPSELQEAIRTALKAWHETTAETSSLAELHLYRQARLNGAANARQAANQVLLTALEALAVQHEAEADLLRQHFLDGVMIRALAHQLNLGESTVYRRQKEALERLGRVLQNQEKEAKEAQRHRLLQRLEPPAYTQLIGFEGHLEDLQEKIVTPEPPWLLAIEGLGGLGKTSLADALLRRIINGGWFADVGWVSARQQIYNPGGAIRPVALPALTPQDLAEKLLAQLWSHRRPDNLSAAEVQSRLAHRLKQAPHLLVIDNLETLTDLESLLPTLREWAGPTKILLTSREAFYHEPGLYHFKLPALSEADTLRLLRHEARLSNQPHVAQADDDTLGRIYRAVGGNPLALRLVVGQTHQYDLETILTDLAAAHSQKVETLYRFIYRRAWDHLAETTRYVFLAMPLVADHGGSLEYLIDLTELPAGSVQDALDQLIKLNLVDSRGGLAERRYTIHNLTRTFLQEQVARWQ